MGTPSLQRPGPADRGPDPVEPGLLRRLAGLERELAQLYERAPFGCCVLDREGGMVRANAHARAHLGGAAEAPFERRTLFERLAPHSRERLARELAPFGGLAQDALELELLPRRGRVRTLTLHRPAGSAAAAGGACAVLAFDDTELRSRRAQQRAQALAPEGREALCVTDGQGVVLALNRAFSDITGFAGLEACGQSLQGLAGGRHNPAVHRRLRHSLRAQGLWQGELQSQRKDGRALDVWVRVQALAGASGQAGRLVWSIYDISAHKAAQAAQAAQAAASELAFVDQLTGLPNRQMLLERIRRELQAPRRAPLPLALLILDLDHFKYLNDTHGHGAGDHLLVQVAQRLRRLVGGADLVARIGGDEFVVLLTGLSGDAAEAARQACQMGGKILAALAPPHQLAGFEYSCSASIGISLYEPGSSAAELLQQADMAMYQAKQSGRNGCRLFNRSMRSTVTAKAALEQELARAVRQSQFVLHYQPQVDAQRRILGAEALLRWQHPERGLVGPGEFIDLAEESGLILPIGQWVLDSACAQLRAWQQHPGLRGLQLAVNVSARQFVQPDFVEQVQAVLGRHAVHASRLKLELTESTVHDIADTRRKMDALRRLGISFSLDDFGTGYSSLASMTRLPLSQLKIDRSFVHHMGASPADAIVVHTIIGMANSLGLELIAEGVETEAQLQALVLSGCRRFQGYLFSPPVAAEAFGELVRRQAV